MDQIASQRMGIARRHRHGQLLALALSTLGFAIIPPVLNAGTEPTEYQVKAAYLLNFARFVKWPADSPFAHGPSFEICILGRDPFGATLDTTVAGEKLDGAPVTIRRLTDVSEAKTCRIIFISKSEEPHLAGILHEIDSSDALTVSDIPHFSKRGGMIEFMPEGSRVGFGINLDSALRSRLTVSSELLKVATTVITSARAGGMS